MSALFHKVTKTNMRRTILLADDSPTIRRLVVQTFSDANFEIVEVSNGDAAIKAVDEVRPSVVLADIYMPGKNGYQVCTYVRNHPTLGNTPVVLLVGAFDAFDEQSAREVGATANITKPFEPGALIELVTSIMGPESEEVHPAPAASPVPVQASPASPAPEPIAAPAPAPAPVESTATEDDLLGLGVLFKEEPQERIGMALSEQEIERIADRVIQKISNQVVESIAWDVVPDITEKILREELKRIR